MSSRTAPRETFYVEIIKPSHYDDDGYVIQWVRSLIPSNSLACVAALADDVRVRKGLGENVDIEIRAYDEIHTHVPVRKIIRRIKKGGGRGFVLLAGVQSNQFPRAADIAKEFRDAGIDVAIGGFHVSGCLSMLPELPPDIQAVQETGVILFAGELEGRMQRLMADAYHQRLQPVYNFLDDLPGLEGQVPPFLPKQIAERSFSFATFDVGRGCPFRCSFCTIINVQGRKSRHRNADDVEHLIRNYLKAGINWFFITDDNMARNNNWESIFDRLIELRENEGLKFKLMLQVDTQCHKIKGFIEKAARAGTTRVFIGMENVNPENLKAAKKFQNRISEYRKMLQAWREQKVLSYAGYILGFPADTPEGIERDIKTIQRELPVDILEFFVLTPLPGSADHRDMYNRGEWMDPDMNNYDTEHVTTHHPQMTKQEWQDIYDRAWHLYYTDEHIETMLRRAEATRTGMSRLQSCIYLYYGSYKFHNLHPLQCGLFRKKNRRTRRPTMPRENPFLFYPRRLWEEARRGIAMLAYFWKLSRIRAKIKADPLRKEYTDESLEPVIDAVDEKPVLEILDSPPPAARPEPALIPLPILSQDEVLADDAQHAA